MEPCPEKERLEILLAEGLSSDERTRVEIHVEHCEACQDTLNDLTEVAPAFKQPSRNSDPSETLSSPQVEAFFNRLKRMEPVAVARDRQDRQGSNTIPIAIDGYDILTEIGRGGVGVVYKARHLKLNRLVALKVILNGPHLSPDFRQRFRVEAQAIARLQHRGIVQVFDVGEHANFPFLSLELIEGGSLADQMTGKPRPPAEAAPIIKTLAKAIEYAHRNGVIHRDLKPANVLLHHVPDRPEQRELKVTDFGIAKVLPQAGIEARMTQTGAILGTPAYMAPEQARGNAHEICPATDIYSLGCMLYELLTGRPPFQGATPVDTLMQAANQDPVPITLLVPRVPRDLNTICLKCLEKDSARRYSTAAELADDLEHFLKHEPISARPLSWTGHGLRWMRRHRGLAAALSVVTALLMIIVLGSLIATAHFRSMEQMQRSLATDKEQIANEKEIERGKAVDAERQEAQLRQQAENEDTQLRQRLYYDQMNLASHAAILPGGIGRVTEWLAPWATANPDLRNWEWYYLNGLCHRDILTLKESHGGFYGIAWSPDGRRIASGGTSGTVRIWDVIGGQGVRDLRGHTNSVFSVSWSPDGRWLASGSWDNTVKIWNATTGAEVLTFKGHSSRVYAVAWSRGGTQIASGGRDGTIQIWNAKTGNVDHILRGHELDVRHIAWSPDGKQIASAGADFSIRTWDAASGRQLLLFKGHTNWVNWVAWNSAGTRIASASNDHTARIWDASTGSEVQAFRGHRLAVSSIAWSLDGHQVASGGDDGVVKIWNVDTGIEIRAFRGHTQAVQTVAWSPDGTRLASSSCDSTIKFWNLSGSEEIPTLTAHTGAVPAICWSPDGSQLASGGADRSINVWDAHSGQVKFAINGHSNVVQSVAWSPSGKSIASASLDNTIRVWDAGSGKQISCFQAEHQTIGCIAWSPDGTRIASADGDQTVRIWDANDGRELKRCKGHIGAVNSVAWSPDGTRLASGSADHTIKIWDVSTGGEIVSLTGHTLEVNGVAWSFDGRRIASGSWDQTVKIWDATTGQLQISMKGHAARVTAVAWSPDGTRIASASADSEIKLWDTATGGETLNLECGTSVIEGVAWSPDGVALAAAGDDGAIRIYDASSGYIAAFSPQYLPALDHRIAKNPNNAADWELRAQIDAHRDDWTDAASDVQRYFALNPGKTWCTLGCWVVGPFPDDLNANFPPETDSGLAHPVQSIAVPSAARLSWIWVANDRQGYVNLGELFNNAPRISAYAQVRIYSAREQKVAILAGSDDQLKMWLNGKNIHESLVERAAVPDDDAVSATLSPGWNVLLTRVVNITDKHELYLRLSDTPADIERAQASAAKSF